MQQPRGDVKFPKPVRSLPLLRWLQRRPIKVGLFNSSTQEIYMYLLVFRVSGPGQSPDSSVPPTTPRSLVNLSINTSSEATGPRERKRCIKPRACSVGSVKKKKCGISRPMGGMRSRLGASLLIFYCSQSQRHISCPNEPLVLCMAQDCNG